MTADEGRPTDLVPIPDAYQDEDGRVRMNLRKHPEGWPGAYDFDAGCTPLVLHDAADVGHLRRWKAEAMPVLAGLQDLGVALGLRLGESITGRTAVDAALDLRNDRDRFQAANRDHIDRIDVLEAELAKARAELDVYNQTDNDRLAAVVNAEIRAEDAEAQRDALRAKLAAVEALADRWDARCASRCLPRNGRPNHAHDCGMTRQDAADELRAARNTLVQEKADD